MSRYIHFVTDRLREAGHKVELLFANDLMTRNRNRLSRFVTPVRIVQAVRSRLAAGGRYDVVEVHEPIAAGYALARRFSRRLPPLLVTVYALEARSQEARIRYARAKRRPLGWRSRLGPISVVCQANLALRLADQVCVETSEDADYIQSRLGVPPHRVTIQHGGVGPEFFTQPSGGRNGILFLGTWIERKGILDLVPAVSALLDRRPGVRFTVAGCGCSAEQVLSAFPNRHRSNIRVVQKIADDAALAELYRSHAVFAFPSTFEGLPLVILEAAAAGLAIVTTSVCGMKDMIQNGQNGLLVRVGESVQLTAALDQLVGNPELVARLGRSARDSVRQFTWARSTEQFLSACQAACSRGGYSG
jgi:glycosyltransferase involved in cell wall biosynthesis